MADAPEEAAEMAAIASSLVLNIGTLNAVQIESMILAGRMANERRIPVILDPVGAGATRFRTETTKRLLDETGDHRPQGQCRRDWGYCRCRGGGAGRGLLRGERRPAHDSPRACKDTWLTVAVSGATDIVTDGKQTLLVENGHPLMGSISGTGCMAASVTGAFCAESKEPVTASAAALAALRVLPGRGRRLWRTGRSPSRWHCSMNSRT